MAESEWGFDSTHKPRPTPKSNPAYVHPSQKREMTEQKGMAPELVIPGKRAKRRGRSNKRPARQYTRASVCVSYFMIGGEITEIALYRNGKRHSIEEK